MNDTEKDQTELEDTILGAALARAIETQPVRETPFASSRVAARPAERTRSFVWQALSVAAVMVLGLAIGAALLGQRRSQGMPVATQPGATAPAQPPPTAQATSAPVVAAPVPITVYFAREGLPPIGATVLRNASPANGTVETRISNRIGALLGAHAQDVPAGATDLLRPPLAGNWSSLHEMVVVSGTTATVDLTTDPPLAPQSAPQAKEIVQQLVYTITEEPGIDRVVLLSGGKPMVLGTYPAPTGALARWDVAGYAVSGLTGAFQFEGASTPTQLTTSYANEAAPGVARFTISVSGLPAHAAPAFTVSAYDSTHIPGANAELEVTVPNGSDTTTAADQLDTTPVRAVAVGKSNAMPAQVYRLGLDHLWPWRAVVLYDPTRIVIDIGGAPSAISLDQNVVVYAPTPNAEIGRTFTVSGAARAYEGTVSFRVRDDRQNVVLYGYAKASIGTSDVWGEYDATVTLPASVTGNVTFEVFEISPKDGTETATVAIPLRVHPG